jgi:hypothetical protein
MALADLRPIECGFALMTGIVRMPFSSSNTQLGVIQPPVAPNAPAVDTIHSLQSRFGTLNLK